MKKRHLFSQLTKQFSDYGTWREGVIRAGREVLRDAKKIIFLCHDGKLKEAERALSALARRVRSSEARLMKPISSAARSLYGEGSWRAAVEEYLEAWFFYHIVVRRAVVEPIGVHAPAEVYIGALADATGEVSRNAVMRGASRDLATLKEYRALVASIVAFMTPLYLTGFERQKFDQAKKNLRQIETILYDVTIRTT